MKEIDKYNAINWAELVYYDPESPTSLRWASDRFYGINGNILLRASGDVAGGKSGKYYSINLFKKMYYNHRVIWILFNKYIDPTLQIDHIDGNRYNNCIDNLRLVTSAVNNRNSVINRNNTTGITGVSLVNNNKGYKYYCAYWYDIDGNFQQKHFSIAKLGETEAFKQACDLRRQMIDGLNTLGAEYADRHGT